MPSRTIQDDRLAVELEPWAVSLPTRLPSVEVDEPMSPTTTSLNFKASESFQGDDQKVSKRKKSRKNNDTKRALELESNFHRASKPSTPSRPSSVIPESSVGSGKDTKTKAVPAATQVTNAPVDKPPEKPKKRTKKSGSSKTASKKKAPGKANSPSKSGPKPSAKAPMSEEGSSVENAKPPAKSKSQLMAEKKPKKSKVEHAPDPETIPKVAKMPSSAQSITTNASVDVKSVAKSKAQGDELKQKWIEFSSNSSKAPHKPSSERLRSSSTCTYNHAEAKSLAKKDGRSRSFTDRRQTARQEPGAFLVDSRRGTLRAHSGVLSPQSQSSSKKNGPLEHAPPFEAESVLIAAELSTDMERQIEEEVQRRIISQAAKAHVISVVQGVRMLDPEEEARRIADLRELHKPRGIKERLFGDARNPDIDIASSPESIYKRSYLKWTVKRNMATNLWVASVQTSQKSIETNDLIEVERTTASFPATTQQEAFETGLANAVPMMQFVEEYPICYVCKAKFAIFRRPQHCRNCGVCVCTSCSTTWPAKMFPETFNAKAVNNVCIACDWLAKSFRDALVEGDFKSAVHLYATGNINLRVPYSRDRRTEAMYPIHLAVLGGNLKLVKWLVNDHYCPLRLLTKKGKSKTDGAILTSKGRSPLAIACLHQKLDIVRFLVADMNVSLFDEKELNSNLALANFTSLLKMLPRDFFDGRKVESTSIPNSASMLSMDSFGYSSSDTSSSTARNYFARRPSM